MTYAISTTDGDHLGFILLSGGPDEGQCLVRSLPAVADHFELPESEYLHSLQLAGELAWERANDEFRIYGPDGDVALTERAGRMTGARFVFVVEAVT